MVALCFSSVPLPSFPSFPLQLFLLSFSFHPFLSLSHLYLCHLYFYLSSSLLTGFFCCTPTCLNIANQCLDFICLFKPKVSKRFLCHNLENQSLRTWLTRCNQFIGCPMLGVHCESHNLGKEDRGEGYSNIRDNVLQELNSVREEPLPGKQTTNKKNGWWTDRYSKLNFLTVHSVFYEEYQCQRLLIRFIVDNIIISWSPASWALGHEALAQQITTLFSFTCTIFIFLL